VTDAQRSFLLAVAAAEGERQPDHNANVISRCADAGYVTTRDVSEGMRYARWYMTARGLASLETEQ
tara:strand:- start:9356 stop:9553 length:198 start_codon:yes stop_codon:yes gene_type:complete